MVGNESYGCCPGQEGPLPGRRRAGGWQGQVWPGRARESRGGALGWDAARWPLHHALTARLTQDSLCPVFWALAFGQTALLLHQYPGPRVCSVSLWLQALSWRATDNQEAGKLASQLSPSLGLSLGPGPPRPLSDFTQRSVSQGLEGCSGHLSFPAALTACPLPSFSLLSIYLFI